MRRAGRVAIFYAFVFFCSKKNEKIDIFQSKNKRFHWKTMLLKRFFNSYEKHRKVPTKMPEAKCFKKINSHEKRPQNRFPKCLKPKKLTFPLKKITLFQESLKIRIKKVYRTVFQNAWSQKNKHSYWKNNSV